MAEVDIPVATEPIVQEPDKTALLLRLDELLEEYLGTLDRYQRAREQLSKHLSSGFLALAQANFSNPSRTRYGQDYYDDRMNALRKIDLSLYDFTVTFAVSKLETTPKASGSDRSPRVAAEGTKEEAAAAAASAIERTGKEQDSIGRKAKEGHNNNQSPDAVSNATADLEDASTSSEGRESEPDKIHGTAKSESSKNSTTSQSKAIRDPLRWFGILVPPALRSAQSAFVSAVEEPIPELANLAGSLRNQEITIQRLRKQIRKL